MSQKAYLAFDLGAESGRAMLGLFNDGKLTLEEMHRFPNTPQQLPSGFHWSILALWGNLLEGLRKAGQYAKENEIEIVSLGVDTWGVDFGLVGSNGQLLGVPYAYRDERNNAAMDKTLELYGKDQLYAATGIQFMPFNSLFQLMAYQEHEPEVLALAERLLFTPDLLHYFFSGKMVNEASIASTSQMVDPKSGGKAWAKEVLSELGLPTNLLGEIVNAGTVVGTLTEEVADQCQVSSAIKVITPAGHDTASAFAAAPLDSSKNNLILSSGTWSLMGVELQEPVLTEEACEAGFTNEGGVDGTIRFLTNIMGLWLVQETRRAFEAKGEVYDYVQLTKMASEAKPLQTLVNPNYGPFMQPGKMLEKIAAFAEKTGQPVPQTVGEYVRCCTESLALTYRHTKIKMEALLKQEMDVIHIVGGGGKNELLDQMTADACGLPVIVGPYEGTAAGNLLVQAMGCGDIADLSALRDVVIASFEPKHFEPNDVAAWDEAYERYVKLLDVEP